MSKNKLLKFFNAIRNFGVEAHQSPLEQERIRLLNDVGLFLLFIEFLFFITYILSGQYGELVGVAIRSTLAFFYLIFNYLKKTKTARLIFIIILPLAVGSVIALAGNSIPNNAFFLILPAVVTILFSKVTQQIIFILYIVGIYLFVDIYQDLNPPEIIRSPPPMAVFIAFTAVSIIVYMFFSRFIKASLTTNALLLKQSESIAQNNLVLETNQKRIEQQQSILERTNKELEQFAYVASHDLKTPLRGISSFLSLINRKLKDHPDKSVQEYLTFASNSAKQMHFLIEDILEYSRLGDKSLVMNMVDLNQVVVKVRQNIASYIDEKNGEIIVENDLPNILASETQLVLLLQNLIQNGLKYNDSKTPTIWIKNVSFADIVSITITDNGLGIEEEHFETIFQMFQRLHGQEKYQGSGVGLAICKKIVEQYGGRITVAKNPAGGSIFKIEIPSHDKDRILV